MYDEGKRESVPYLRTMNYIFVTIGFIVAVILLIADSLVVRGFETSERANERYLSARVPALELEAGSDYLTDRVRCFVVTGQREYMDDYFEEVQITRRRDNALAELEELLEGSGSEAYQHLSVALAYSNELMEREYRAMRLMQQALGLEDVPAEVAAVTLSAEELALPPQEQRALAVELTFDQAYMDYKEKIRDNVRQCTAELINTASQSVSRASGNMSRLLTAQLIMTVIMLLVVLALVVFISSQVRKPLTRMVKLMREQELVPPSGAAELRFVTRTYNEILTENTQARQKLTYEATHDALTDLYNRGAYDMFMQSMDLTHVALVLVDVDEFKTVNDTYGHTVGDQVLKRVADTLKHSFRSVDVICRYAGDEFVVIMTRVNSAMTQLVLEKMVNVNKTLAQPEDGLPPVSLSVGVAFADRPDPQGDLFKDADSACYRVKETGRHGVCVYPDILRR